MKLKKPELFSIIAHIHCIHLYLSATLLETMREIFFFPQKSVLRLEDSDEAHRGVEINP